MQTEARGSTELTDATLAQREATIQALSEQLQITTAEVDSVSLQTRKDVDEQCVLAVSEAARAQCDQLTVS